MTILIGTDEAGYGPNLGPLVIAATAWDVPDEADDCDLYQVLSEAVSPVAAYERMAIADSKQLFKQGGTLANLELGVHAALAMLQSPAGRWRDLFSLLDATSDESLAFVPWYRDYDEAIPFDLSPAALQGHSHKLAKALRSARVSLVALRAAIIFPSQFNQRVAQLGSKGALLTERTLELVRDVIALCPAADAENVIDRGNVIVQCDKHGGRNRYAAALQHTWPNSWIDIHEEGRPKSTYELNIDGRNTRISFAVGGESQLPAALASMTAKYLRELAMRAFNTFWRQELPDLRPTAGYPTDAKRFRADIAAAQSRLQINDDMLWRCR